MFYLQKMEGHFGEIAGTEINGSMGSIYDITLRETNIAGWKIDHHFDGYLAGKMGDVHGRTVSFREGIIYVYVFFWYLFKPLQTPKSSLGQNSSHVGQVGPQKTAEFYDGCRVTGVAPYNPYTWPSGWWLNQPI